MLDISILQILYRTGLQALHSFKRAGRLHLYREAKRLYPVPKGITYYFANPPRQRSEAVPLRPISPAAQSCPARGFTLRFRSP